VGTTSITVTVEVYAERNHPPFEVVKVTEATLTYVATDENRRPRKVPPMPATQASNS
jgi:acyl-CoA thioesterase YciA